MNEYEISGIETIARGVFIRQGKILLCRAKNGSSTYLPGGHIEFGETGRDALVREIKEETGRDAEIGSFLGVFENTFLQKGKKHAEINLVYAFTIQDVDTPVEAQESWIEFLWCDLCDLEKVNLLPEKARCVTEKEGLMFIP
jgi:ADP-ribose pyrophosphatase YjhB (NUDIX family)